MDSAIISALIGAAATVIAVVIAWWLQHKKIKNVVPAQKTFKPDNDDIYFMKFLLHDAYEESKPLSTSQLAEHHMSYAPLELEVKLISLEKNGYIQRVSRKNSGMGLWQMLPKGVEFMFVNGHQLHDLIEEQKIPNPSFKRDA